MNCQQLRELIVQPTLRYLDPEIKYSEAAVELLLMTCAHESNMGEYIAQVNGPALGIYQMEPNTAKDIYDNFLKYKEGLRHLIHGISALFPLFNNYPNYLRESRLVHDLVYATAMARVHYYRDKEALPDVNDIEGLARYAKRVYNTELGAANWQNYYTAYNRHCL